MVGLGRRGLREGGESVETKNFKKMMGEGGKLGQGVVALKRGGWNPLTSYALLPLNLASWMKLI